MAKKKSRLPRVKNYIKRQPEPPGVKFSSDEYLTYGANDNFPLTLSQLVMDSPSASSCISVISDFIEGDGFSSEIGDMVVNAQGERLADIHHMVSESLAMYEGFALNVKYNAEAKISQIYFTPFENCRLGHPDSKGIISCIKYNPYFGTDAYQRNKIIDYDTFNPNPQVVMSQMQSKGSGYRGQILWWGSTRALSRFYPKPSYYSAADWMEVDHRIGEYHKNNLRNGFLQAAIFKLIGNPNSPSTDPDNSVYDEDNQKQEQIKTIGEEFNDMMIENFSGTERVGNVMAFWASSKEEFPLVEAFPTSVNSQLLDTIQAQTTKNITIATKVPAILANIHEGVSLGGDGNTIKAAVKLMQQRAGKWQAVLEGVYKRIFEAWIDGSKGDIEIVDHNPFPEDQTIDPTIWDALNPATKKKWIMDNTSIEWVEDVVQPTPSVQNAFYDSYPQKSMDNAKKAIKWNEQHGQCGTKMGWETAELIANGSPLSYKTIKRLRNYLKKNEISRNAPFNESCEAVLYHAWGGKEFLEWADSKIKDIEG